MKRTTKILATMLLLFIAGLFLSNTLLKREYERVDKSDLYWTYAKVFEQPFSHLNIEGGNITNIAFEQNKNPSVKILKDWSGSKDGRVKMNVKNDTLFIRFPNTYDNIYEKDWMKWSKLVRISSPQLLSVTGTDTKFEMFKMKQKSIRVNLKGKSEFELESMDPEFDSLHITQSDSSAVVFEMSPEYKTTGSFHVKWVDADIKGASFLDVGHAQIDSLKLTIADSSGVLLSGGTLKKKKVL
jgi:hypothetical protein